MRSDQMARIERIYDPELYSIEHKQNKCEINVCLAFILLFYFTSLDLLK